MAAFRGCKFLLVAAKSSTIGASKSKATTAKTSKVKQVQSPSGRPTGLFKVTPVSPTLQSFIGVSETNRTDAIKKIWDYIKLHNLQNPANKREIICDEKLKTLFGGKDKVGFLEITKLLSAHFVKPN